MHLLLQVSLSVLPLLAGLAGLGLFLTWRRQRDPKADWREASLFTAIAAGALVAVSSELLSLAAALNRWAVAGVWAAALAACAFLFWKARRALPAHESKPVLAFMPRPAKGAFSLWPFLSAHWELLAVGVYLVVTLGVALLAPPNTNDSLQYHLSRVMHWAQNGSLSFYPTPIERQLWMPPWAELAVLHSLLLSGGDRLANLVQWVCMLVSLFAGTLIASRLGADRCAQILTAVVGVTLPIGILQATSTQTDYATALWLVLLVYFAVLAYQRPLSWDEWLAASLAVGLGMLTKGSFYAFAAPFLLWILIVTLRRDGARLAGKALLLGVVVVLGLNAGVWMRNFQAYRFPLGPRDGLASLSNEKFTLGAAIGNLLRNTTLHLGTPYGVINGPLREGVEWLLRLMGEDANDPLTTLSPSPYRVRRSRHEDSAGNPLHLALFLLAGIALFLLQPLAWRARRGGRPADSPLAAHLAAARWVWGMLALGAVIFSVLYKWQPTGSRLQLPFFVAAMPLAGLAWERAAALPVLSGKWVKITPWLRPAVSLLLLISGLSLLFDNPSRALWPSQGSASLLSQPRQEVLFANSPEVMPGYLSLIAAAQATGCQEIGLMIDSHDPEYPFWALLSPSAQEIRLEHLSADAVDAPCAILCTYCREPVVLGLPRQSEHFGGFSLYTLSPAQP